MLRKNLLEFLCEMRVSMDFVFSNAIVLESVLDRMVCVLGGKIMLLYILFNVF